ncbi:hypothetical protein BU23DRAFT_572344 [Bimuria novae-zelandiae CBS 107.79]|uniref:Uncharacterized protein n=1 Tax=Bimuria novae-zelandiae CBS 107.79 TaxID=1447943 RepID=A0A6A5UXB3_9PLEO|nr:hypothetical protein BU23DRAFT_572344 [Bimuria novae-zelandiae CBS 107.79]
MTIFSRIKRASKAPGELQITSVTEPAGIIPSSPTRPAPLPPIDLDKPAVVLTADEVRARIAANRKRQSDIIRRSAALSYTPQSCAMSEYSLPGSGWQTHRIKEPTSIEAILREMPVRDAELLPPPLVMRGRASIQNNRTLSRRHSGEEFYAYSNPRPVPLPPPIKTHALPPPRSRSRRLTKTKQSSPLSTVSTQQDEEYFSSSSRDSARNSASTTDSVASLATSTSSIVTEQVETKRTSIKIPNFSKPSFAARREMPVKELDISLPYSSNAEGVEEQVKTAKCLIPTWRYEDLRTDNELPLTVTTIPPTHTRNMSWGHTRKPSFSAYNHVAFVPSVARTELLHIVTALHRPADPRTPTTACPRTRFPGNNRSRNPGPQTR